VCLLSHRFLVVLLFAAFLAAVAPSAHGEPLQASPGPTGFPERPADVDAQTWAGLRAAVHEAKLLPRPNGIGGENSEFGYSVSVDGNRALVGGTNLAGSGGALVLVNDGSGWQEEAVLLPADGESSDQFGYSVSLSGDRALIGARWDDDNGANSGSAYVFDFNGTSWSETDKLTAADAAASDEFGFSVSLSGDRALIAARLDDDNGSQSGSAYVFDFDATSWSETDKLTASDGAAFDQFGWSVSLSGDRALIGAYRDDDNGGSSGSAYVFDFNGTSWSETTKLKPTDGAAGDQFGDSVSLSGDRALIGAVFDDDNGSSSGSAYVFDFNGTSWSETAKLTASDGAASDLFGVSVSLAGDRALIGAHRDDDSGSFSGSAYVFDFNGTSWIETDKLTASDGAAFDQFGYSVSLSGDRALIGAHLDDDSGTDSGSAYVFDFDGTSWSETDKLIADGAAGDQFGVSVSLAGDRALIGTRSDDDNGSGSGSAYVFDFDGTSWSETAKLTASDGAASDYFGWSVSLSGDRALIGAHRDDENGSDSGSAYVFDFDGSTWSETAKLTASDGAALDHFGWSVSLLGDRALIGAYRDEDNGFLSGSAYVFDFNGTSWSETDKLTANDGAAGDEFGYSVSLSGDRALIGAYLDDDNGTNSGSAYVFDFNGTSWSETDKLTASDGAASDNFGWSVSLSGDRALIGANRDDDRGTDSGSAYVFDFSGTSWSETSKLTPTDGAAGDFFGSSISLSGNRALISAHFDDDSGSDSGSAYVFDFDGTSWSETSKLKPSDGAAADRFGNSVSLSGDRALIGAYGDDDRGSDSGSAYAFSFNQPPIAQDDAFDLLEDQPLSDNVFADNSNGIDNDPDSDPFQVQSPGTFPAAGIGGSVTTQANGDFSYTPPLNASGVATFDYTIVDPSGATDSATVTITVAPVNDPPTFSAADPAAVLEDAGSQSIDNWATFDTGAPNESQSVLAYDVSNISAPGLFAAGPAVDANGTLTYTPAADANGSSTFEVTVQDDGGTVNGGDDTSAPQTFTITVNAVDDPPVAVDDSATLPEDAPATAIDVLTNDTDIDGGPIAIDSVTQPPAGTVAITGDGSGLTYAPDPDACNDGSPTDDFTYTLAPGGSSATVAVTVTCVNDAPIFNSGGSVQALEDAAYSAIWATGISAGPNEGGQTLQFSITSNTNPALFASGPTIDETGLLVFKPVADTTGSAEITVIAEDDGGTSNGGVDQSAPAVFPIEIVEGVDVSVEKTLTVNGLQQGAQLTYSIEVGNAGPSDIAGVLVENPPPPELDNASWTCVAQNGASCGSANGSGPISVTVDLPEASSVSFVLEGTIPEITTNPITSTASATLPAGSNDVDMSNNSDTLSIALRIFSDSFGN
jgi:uncharacterized repeat protein (TIGR01451 family)